ncbi:DUF3014 domain-containing protein [Myxococcus sp. K38C18041901]|uniref:DUF3014 domain-containing protein n=1 Tax=Myxococcus guangdongensis TaxID=2906760 RepID=UPI0020A79F58|nr:DUF3014 domain-containing protein [Myxococcus guangdongensis]MCP3061712.1 DUF3014 domain-containing protein [Myxococcus guangdongensis]
MSEPTDPMQSSETPTSSSAGKKAALIGGPLVAVGVGVAVALGVFRGKQPEPVPVVAEAPKPVDAGVAPVTPTESLPESDGRVRELASRMSEEAELQRWLQEKDLVRRVTAAVNNVAEGASPRMVLGFLAPTGGFQVVEGKGKDKKMTVDPRSHARYDLIARVFGTFDAQVARSLFRDLKPLIDQAHREIAPPGQAFDSTLNRAIEHLLSVPVPEGALEVQPQGGLYVYASPELEGLSKAQKHLLRMGPQNIRVIQAKLKELQTALDLPPVAER